MRLIAILGVMLGLVLTLPPTFACNGSHEHSTNTSDYQRLGEQVSQVNLIQADKNPVWAKTSTVINKSAIEKPTVSPVSLRLLDGKIVPSSSPRLKQADVMQSLSLQSSQFASTTP